jgi:hypothetical protein
MMKLTKRLHCHPPHMHPPSGHHFSCRLETRGVTAGIRATMTEPHREGVRRQDQLERFSATREHNQHT